MKRYKSFKTLLAAIKRKTGINPNDEISVEVTSFTQDDRINTKYFYDYTLAYVVRKMLEMILSYGIEYVNSFDIDLCLSRYDDDDRKYLSGLLADAENYCFAD